MNGPWVSPDQTLPLPSQTVQLPEPPHLGHLFEDSPPMEISLPVPLQRGHFPVLLQPLQSAISNPLMP